MHYELTLEDNGNLGIGPLKLFELGLQIDGVELGRIFKMNSGNYHSGRGRMNIKKHGALHRVFRYWHRCGAGYGDPLRRIHRRYGYSAPGAEQVFQDPL